MYVLLKGKANYGKMNLHTPMCVFENAYLLRGGRFLFILLILLVFQYLYPYQFSMKLIVNYFHWGN